ncbi:MAG: ABC transporter permease subunit [Clostridia bacterium]|nr:ABC transporter permease subunit [Clostridia bacterium]MBQ7914408.1 ABC transporter permease subunit [Clostridia bacterium]MBQ8772589.1 ABC transporter permease subunit [Clostridia bacterium]MBQ8872662.1 ABC transporter permease subunit [Clostridia bacterium]
MKAKKTADAFLTYAILLIVSIIFVFPCFWLLLSCFSASGSIYSFNGFFPSEFSLNSFKILFTDTVMYNYVSWFWNTMLVAVVSSLIGTVLVILTAYTISTFEFKGRKVLMKGALVLGMFPSFMGMTAVYLLMTQFGFINSHIGLALIYACGAPMGYLVQKGFFDTIPKSIYEAASIDGASNLRIFCTITMPLSKPMIVYTLLTQFAWPWSDYILPKLLLKDKDLWTVAVGLMSLPETEFARFSAGSVFIAVPIVILYFFLSKYLINGMSAGAVKQ